jgi:hypothetical protein
MEPYQSDGLISKPYIIAPRGVANLDYGAQPEKNSAVCLKK